jgi:hypothetical protein
MNDLDLCIDDLGRAMDYMDRDEDASAYLRIADALSRLMAMRDRSTTVGIWRDDEDRQDPALLIPDR